MSGTSHRTSRHPHSWRSPTPSSSSTIKASRVSCKRVTMSANFWSSSCRSRTCSCRSCASSNFISAYRLVIYRGRHPTSSSSICRLRFRALIFSDDFLTSYVTSGSLWISRPHYWGGSSWSWYRKNSNSKLSGSSSSANEPQLITKLVKWARGFGTCWQGFWSFTS